MKNLIRRFLCWIGWHDVVTYKDDNDPHKFLTFGKCKFCGKEGQIDSQGNLF